MNIYIAEIFRPGTWLIFPDQEISREVEQMLYHMEDLVTEAAITLALFEAAPMPTTIESYSVWERDMEIRQEVTGLLKQEIGDLHNQEYDQYRVELERRVLMRKAELGIMPESYSHKVPFIHAHSFIYAVDSFGKFLEELCEYRDLPRQVTELRDRFDAALPTIRKIRNSALHIEDRSRGYGTLGEKRKGIRMQTNGFLGLSNLEGNHLCYTIDDGSYQRVPINADTLNTMASILNQLLGSFEWKGPSVISPR